MRYHQGRLLDHVHLRVRDFGRACEFYRAVLEALGHGPRLHIGRDWLELDELYIDEAGADPVSQVHLAFQAADRAAVAAFHAAGLGAGGRDNGAPGLRDYHPGYYAAYLLDPDGNNVEAKCDERVTARSAVGVEITAGA